MIMKKIMFNDELRLTQAVLDGRKTQTRRFIKPQPTYSDKGGICWKGRAYGLSFDDWEYSIKGACRNFVNGNNEIPYKVGEVVAIAQRYNEIWNLTAEEVDIEKHQLPDGKMVSFSAKGVNNKMFVKPEYMPHRIRITNVRIERLQDISYQDCLDEGIVKDTMEYDEFQPEYFYHFGIHTDESYETPQEAYAALIDKLNGKGTWKSNPWVWVYEMTIIK